MAVCYYADLIMYFLVGFLIVIVWRQPKPNKPQTWTDRSKLYAMAILAGLLFAGIRFAMQKYCGYNTLKEVNTLISQTASASTPLAQAFPGGSEANFEN